MQPAKEKYRETSSSKPWVPRIAAQLACCMVCVPRQLRPPPSKLGRCKAAKIGHLLCLKTPGTALKKTKFTEAQTVFALRPADTGMPFAEVCRKRGISEATCYNWKKKSSTSQPVADLSLDK